MREVAAIEGTDDGFTLRTAARRCRRGAPGHPGHGRRGHLARRARARRAVGRPGRRTAPTATATSSRAGRSASSARDASLPLRAALLERIASHRVVLTNGVELDADVADALKRMDVEVRTEPRGPASAAARSAIGRRAWRASVRSRSAGSSSHTAWARPRRSPSSSDSTAHRWARSWSTASDRTSRPGVYAAGDIAQRRDCPMPMASVLAAAAGWSARPRRPATESSRPRTTACPCRRDAATWSGSGRHRWAFDPCL